jgi:hypothetical protein
MRRAFIIVIPVLALAAACGGSSPTEPSGNGASISGQFVTPGGSGNTRSLQAASPNASVQGITVSVSGTDISAAVKGGQFSLSGVPAGPLSLRFTGSGTDSELGLEPVQGGEDIDLTVSLNGSTVTLESQRRSFGKEIQLEGLIESLTLPTLVVAGQTVTTIPAPPDQTRYFYQGQPATTADLGIGFRVHVKGQAGTGGSLTAVTIMIQSKNVTDDEDLDDEGQVSSASIEGVLLSIGAGAFPDLQVGNTTVHTDGATWVHRKGDKQDLEDLFVGMILHVVGTRQADGSILARKIQIKGDAQGGAVEIQGSMGGVKGTCAAMTFSVNGYKVATDAITDFVPDCTPSAYKSGTKVTVEGTLQNGTIIATTVTKD